ncbi:MAG: sensor histidine kinase [Acidimicrobiales bacterium]
MTLRSRLVTGLVALMAVGLAIFGVTTYELYSRSQYRQLNSDLQSSVPLVTEELAQAADVTLPLSDGPGASQSRSGGPDEKGRLDEPQPPPGGSYRGGPYPSPEGGPGGPVLVPPGTYGELLSQSGSVLSSIRLPVRVSAPDLTAGLLAGDRARTLRLGSEKGTTGWLAYVGPRLSNGDRVVVALPTSDVTGSLNRLVLIELLGAFGLLLVLSAGAGLVLRRGLSPLEHMADTAKGIAGGDLAQRVQVGAQGTEVDELAAAFNTMLDQIQRAFRQRDATEERLRQFLADASHELRTPLTSIQGFAELFRLGTDDPRMSTATIMRRIEEESARMKGLVEDLLLLARLDQVRRRERAPVDLSVLAADACSDAIAADPQRPVTLAAPQPVVVLGDAAHLRQALANLATNALRHTPAGTPLEVTVGLREGYALVEVRDHGAGLDDEALAHAFDRFWRGDRSRTGTGAGLGLAIVAAVAAEHSGGVAATNAPGGGALFSIRLPLVPAGATLDEAGPADAPERAGSPAGRQPQAVAHAPDGVD